MPPTLPPLPLHVLPPLPSPFQALATQQQGNFYYCFFRVVFDINSSDTPQVRASSLKSYNLTDDEKSVLEELQAWSAHKEALNKKFSITNLKDLSTTHHFINLLAQVVAIRWTEKGDIVLTLWDGSLPTCQSVLVDPFSEHGQVMSDKLMRKASKRCIDVILYDNHVRSIGTKVCPGDFVCIRNVHVKERTADCSVTVHNPQVICGSKRYNLRNSPIDASALDSHCQHIKFIIIIFLTFKGLHELSPSYMKELLTLYCPAHMLQSSSSSLLARTDYNSEDLWCQGVCHLRH